MGEIAGRGRGNGLGAFAAAVFLYGFTLLYGAAAEVGGRVVAIYGDRAGRTLEGATARVDAPRSSDDWEVETIAVDVDPTHVTATVVGGEPSTVMSTSSQAAKLWLSKNTLTRTVWCPS